MGRTEPPGRGGEVTGRARPWRGEGAGGGDRSGGGLGPLARAPSRPPPPFAAAAAAAPGMSSNCTSTTAVAVAPLSASKTKTKKKHFVCQKVKLFRASEPILSVLMWGVNHTVTSPSERGPARAHAPRSPRALARQAQPVTPATPSRASCTPTPPLHAVPSGCASPRATRGLVSPTVACRRVLPFPPAPQASCVWLRATPRAQREGLGGMKGLSSPLPLFSPRSR